MYFSNICHFRTMTLQLITGNASSGFTSLVVREFHFQRGKAAAEVPSPTSLQSGPLSSPEPSIFALSRQAQGKRPVALNCKQVGEDAWGPDLNPDLPNPQAPRVCS